MFFVRQLVTRHLSISISAPTLRKFSKIMDKKILCMFDVDGTLTASRKDIDPEMLHFLKNKVRPRTEIALVGGSDYKKISEQMMMKQDSSFYHSVFSENGLVAHRNNKEVFREEIHQHVGEEKLQRFINFALRYMSELTLPCKRGTFIEFRTGLINVCPVGRSCSQAERDEFEAYDKIHKIRQTFVETLRKEFPDLGLVYSIGGQISFDVFPVGWDKTYSLRHIPTNDFDEIHFFGDKTEPGGNDHEIYNHKRVKGHKVSSHQDTKRQLMELLQITES